jgi:hypothetical protein
MAYHSRMSGSYSFLGLTVSKSLYFYAVAAVIFVIGTRREIVAIRRGSGHLVAHGLRILAFMLFATFFFLAVRVYSQAGPPHWTVVLPLIPVVIAISIFLATREAALASVPGKHADPGQDSKT